MFSNFSTGNRDKVKSFLTTNLQKTSNYCNVMVSDKVKFCSKLKLQNETIYTNIYIGVCIHTHKEKKNAIDRDFLNFFSFLFCDDLNYYTIYRKIKVVIVIQMCSTTQSGTTIFQLQFSIQKKTCQCKQQEMFVPSSLDKTL